MASFLAIALAANLLSSSEVDYNSAAARVPDLINEVYVDPPGADASAAGNEYVEIYKSFSGNIGGYQLRNHEGIPLFTFPDMYIPAGTKCIIFLRPNGVVPEGFSPILQNGQAAFASASLPIGSDYLDNHRGGVQLFDNSAKPRLVDAIYWSDGDAPPGGTMGPKGSIGFLDINIRTGRPLGADGSIGRSATPVYHYTGATADFTIHGGPNAAGPTPGRDNSVGSFTFTEIAEQSETLATSAILKYIWGAAAGWLQIEDARIEIVHSFSIGSSQNVIFREELRVADAALGHITLQGEFTASFRWNSNAGSVGYLHSVQGRVESEFGYGFSVNITESTSGFDTNTQTTASNSEVILSVAGRVYPVELRETSVRRRIGPAAWRVETNANIRDFTNLPSRYSRGVAVITETGENTRRVECMITRDTPFAAPLPHTTPGPLGEEILNISADETFHNDDGERILEITNFEVQKDGANIFSFEPGSTPFANLLRITSPTAAGAGTRSGGFYLTLRVPGRSSLTDEPLVLEAALDWTSAPAAGPFAFIDKWLTKGIVSSASESAPQIFAYDPPSGAGVLLNHSIASLRVPRVDFTTALGATALLASPLSGGVPQGAPEVVYANISALLERASSVAVRVGERDEISRDFKLSGK